MARGGAGRGERGTRGVCDMLPNNIPAVQSLQDVVGGVSISTKIIAGIQTDNAAGRFSAYLGEGGGIRGNRGYRFWWRGGGCRTDGRRGVIVVVVFYGRTCITINSRVSQYRIHFPARTLSSNGHIRIPARQLRRV